MAAPPASSFSLFLRKSGRSEAATERCIKHVARFEQWLGTDPAQATVLDLDRYVEEVEREESAKTHLWALAYYFDYAQLRELAAAARERRRQRVAPAGLPLQDLLGVDPELITKLAAARIRTTDALLAATANEALLADLSIGCGINPAALLDVRRICEFTGIRGVGGIRSRLYRDAIGSVTQLATLSPEELIAATERYVATSGFEGVPPTPKEAAFTVKAAVQLVNNVHGSPL